MMERLPIEREIEIMELYADMMARRKDRHAMWDAAIDLQRLEDERDRRTQDATPATGSAPTTVDRGRPAFSVRIPNCS